MLRKYHVATTILRKMVLFVSCSHESKETSQKEGS